MLQALQISQTTFYPQITMEFYFYEFHWKTPIIL